MRFREKQRHPGSKNKSHHNIFLVRDLFRAMNLMVEHFQPNEVTQQKIPSKLLAFHESDKGLEGLRNEFPTSDLN